VRAPLPGSLSGRAAALATVQIYGIGMPLVKRLLHFFYEMYTPHRRNAHVPRMKRFYEKNRRAKFRIVACFAYFCMMQVRFSPDATEVEPIFWNYGRWR